MAKNLISPTRSPLDVVSRLFAGRLREGDVRSLLAYLNSRTTHRFTGVYRFEPGWVVSLALYDRMDPAKAIGTDVKMKESYCWLTGLNHTMYVIEDARMDDRLSGHAARDEVRSYVATVLNDRNGSPWGTLCHFDFLPQQTSPDVIEGLQQCRALVEEFFVRDTTSNWHPDAPSIARTRHSA